MIRFLFLTAFYFGASYLSWRYFEALLGAMENSGIPEWAWSALLVCFGPLSNIGFFDDLQWDAIFLILWIVESVIVIAILWQLATRPERAAWLMVLAFVWVFSERVFFEAASSIG